MNFLNAPEFIFDGSAVTTTAPCYNPVSSNTQSKSSCGSSNLWLLCNSSNAVSRTKLPMFFRGSAGSRKRAGATLRNRPKDRCGHFRRQQCRNARNAGQIRFRSISFRPLGDTLRLQAVGAPVFWRPVEEKLSGYSSVSLEFRWYFRYQETFCVYVYIYIYIIIYGGFLSYGGTPKSSILDWNFPL